MSDDYCDNCGSALSPGAKFCSECGEPVADDGWGASSRRDDAWDEPTGDDYQTRPTPSQTTGDQTALAVLAHVLPLFTWLIGPLIVYVVADGQFATENARNALNWQLMFTVYMLVSFVLVFVAIGIVLLFVVSILNVVFCILAAVKALQGETWEYPATPRIV
ncbi:DUF4870 domain-containing protein [Halobacteria archaeon AArc-dxtr1]|nr:DUF4870 domain-containing protein [Halobacteria archaeon AArc-dxtr1]